MTALETLQNRDQSIWLDSIRRELLESDRWRRLSQAGAQPQRLLWASTGTKDLARPAGYYLAELAAEGTVDTLPEKALLAFAESGALKGGRDIETTEAPAVVGDVGKAGIEQKCETLRAV